ncbi:MAG: SEC-C metal-binding domain-containing protein [Sedimenticolaceae bacterium]
MTKMMKPGRNDPCPCGSGKKYKKCCLPKDAASVTNLNWQKMRRTEGELVHALLKHADKYYGPSAAAEAWDEFSLWSDVPLDPDVEPEVESAFIPWFVFDWVPENAEVSAVEHLPETPVALHYLEHERARIDSYRRRFVEEICSQPYSFFAVKDVDPGNGMTLKDMFLGREIYVHERQATTMLDKGSIIYSRIIEMDGDAIMVGCAPTVIPSAYLHDFIDMRENFEKRVGRIDRDVLREYDIELRTIYYDIREDMHNPVPPQIHNTDGDPLQLTKLHYALSCTPWGALDALATLALVEGAEELTDGAHFDQQGELKSVEFPWLKKGNRQNPGWDKTVLGHIVIDGQELTIEVNSQERADAIKRKITRRLGKRASFRHAVIQSPEKMLEEAARGGSDEDLPFAGSSSEELQALPEVQAKLREMADQHWKAWLDAPLPALQGATPREAAKTSSGRERLEALFLQFGQFNESPQPFSPDVASLRRALGLS